MHNYKSKILENICYTSLVYGRINKKLDLALSNDKIEKLVYKTIQETDKNEFIKKGKNIYITNKANNIRLTINSYTNRIITADKLNKIKPKI